MNPGRSFFRTDRAWQLVDAVVFSKHHLGYSKGCCSSYHTFSSYTAHRSVQLLSFSSMGWNKKRKSNNPVWRQVSTQVLPNSIGESSLDTKSSFQTESAEHVHSEVFSASEVAESTHVSAALEENPDITKAEGVLVHLPLSSNVIDSTEERNSEVSTEKHSVSMEVGSSLMRFIKGKGGCTQKGIEEEMGVSLIFPSSKNEDILIIKGGSLESITKASEKIQGIMDEAVQSPRLDYSHFVSLPLAVHPELVDKLISFQNSVLGNCNPEEDIDEMSDEQSDGGTSEDEGKAALSEEAHVGVKIKLKVEDDNDNDHVKVDVSNIRPVSYRPKAKASNSSTAAELGIDKSIFIKPKTFHLTVLMLKLWNKERISAATEVLKSVSSKVIDALDGRPIYIRLKGLECMRGSLAKARVLYAPVEEIGNEERLMLACQVIINAFVEAGLVLEKDAHQKLKLHATVMNARHRKSKNRKKKFDSFDARGVVDKFGSEEWGEYCIREAHLSQRFVFGDDGYYHCCASIPFPDKLPE